MEESDGARRARRAHILEVIKLSKVFSAGGASTSTVNNYRPGTIG